MRLPRDKKIIVIAPRYFGYEEYIKKYLSVNNDVKLIYENLDQISLFYRFVYTKLNKYKQFFLEHYYKKKIKNHLDADYVFVIRGSSLSKKTVDFIKSKINKNCKYFMYQWDSIKNNNSILDLTKEFDRVLTFDYEDSVAYNFDYLPLFYINELVVKNAEKDIDVLYVCGFHSERAVILKKIKSLCVENQLNLKANLLTNKLVYLKKRYIDKDELYVNVPMSEVSFQQLSLEEMYSLYSRSKVVVDFTHPNQNGLTMRTIECLGCGCKIITNNKNIYREEFYSKDNVLVYDNISILLPSDFIFANYKQLDCFDIQKYELSSWLNEIFRCTYEQNL